MDAVDRLAAYLANEISPDERAAVEADLASDSTFRAQLATMQRADRALERVVSVGPPTGFTRRLMAVVDRTLDEVLPNDPPLSTPTAPIRHAVPRWAPLVAAAAIAVVAIGGVSLVIGNVPETDDMFAADMADSDEAARTDDSGVASLAVPEASDQATEATEQALPEFRDTGRIIADDDLGAYATEDVAQLAATWILSVDEARARSADSFAQAQQTPLAGCLGAVESLSEFGVVLLIETVRFNGTTPVSAFAVTMAEFAATSDQGVSIWTAVFAADNCAVLATTQR